jgi:actin-related protein
LLEAEREGKTQEQIADLEIKFLTRRRKALGKFYRDERTSQAQRAKSLELFNAVSDELYKKELQRDIAQNKKNKELADERTKQREQEQKEREKEQQQKDKQQRLDNERQEEQRGQILKSTETQVQSDKVVFDSASFLAKNEKQYTEQQIKNAEAEALAKEQLYYLSQDLGNAVVTLLGEQTTAGKAVALAQVAADTARALSGALANANSPTPDNVATGGLAGIAKYITLATTIATNAKRAIDIVKSENVSGAASGSASTTGGGFTGSLNAPAVRLPRTEEFTGQQRIYVTEYDISNTQERVRVTEDVSIVK